MEAFRQEIIVGSVVVYMIFCVLTGLWAMRRTHNTSDFFIAGRGLGPIVVALALFSSTLSGFGFVGGPGLVYSVGVTSFWMVVISSTGYAVGFFLVAKRIRMIAELRDCISLPDVVAARYGSQSVRFLIAITIVLGVMGYLATQILAMAVVMQAILAGTETFAEVGLVTCVVISSAVLIFYCVTGGIIASVYTDVVQGAIMIIAGALILFTAMSVFDGGMQEASSIILADDAEAIMPYGAAGIMASLGWFFVFGLGLAGQPHIITKMMMNKNMSDNRTILPMSLFGYAMAALLWISIGIIMRAAVIDGVVDPLALPDDAASMFLTVFANPLLAGVVFAGLFAAIMSTSDAFLNIGTAAIIHDIPRAIGGRSIRNELFWARVVTVLLAIVAASFALYSHFRDATLVAILGAFGWGTFAASIFPVVAVGLNWKGATVPGAITAIIAALLINFVTQLGGYTLPYGISGQLIAFASSMVLFIGVSMLTKKPELASDIDQMMDI
ncbi:MAG: sodium/proline symporter [Pseudomonadota bacterium]|nr:sodium/proline symporter [Pseudomonadota bacterium]MEE3238965.1 sodium/proline symporter [Pseudomonadota bacterium]HBX99994.1 proline permease [Gammaproteobacteria bacterium]|tara:strand:+ start:1028 stop:2524 length:1497 start_codon:yes stop_codon:yes gene_type:complete